MTLAKRPWEIWLVSWDNSVGGSPTTRPALLISNEAQIASGLLIFVCITSERPKAPALEFATLISPEHSQAAFDVTGLDHASFVNLIDHTEPEDARIGRKIGDLPQLWQRQVGFRLVALQARNRERKAAGSPMLSAPRG